ncbi:MAG: hypothetical protein GX231_04355 [Tissierellia bacterium]|nr:hypothetical protein [Tissierellia bacterium]
MGNIRRVFPGGNTSVGFFSYHDNIIDIDRNMLYILKGMPGGGKSSLMRDIGNKAIQSGYNVEFHHCPSDPNSIDGVVIDELRIGIVDGTAPHIIDPKFPGLTDMIVNLGQFIDVELLKLYKSEIFAAKKQNRSAYRKAYNYFKSAKPIYDEIEQSNREKMDFVGINKLTKNVIERIFSKKSQELNYIGFKKRNLFTSAYTPDGFVDYTSTIIDGIKDRYYLNGDIGTGKSTFLSRIADESIFRNYHIEIFNNPLIPSKIDSLYIKELDTIISTSKGIKNYIYTTIDLDEYFNGEHDNVEELQIYDTLINRGIESLSGAKEAHSRLETVYKKCINYDEIDKIKEKLWKEILSYE